MLSAQSKYRNSMLLPAIIVLLVVGVVPFVFALGTSFFFWDLSRPQLGRPFIGLGNYINILTDKNFWQASLRTAIFIGGAVTVELILGVAVALLANSTLIKGGKLFTVVILIPTIIAPVIVGFSWRFMYNYDLGVINYLLDVSGFGKHVWLGEPSIALYSIILTDIWEWTPFVALVIFSGLQTISKEVIDAVKVDGATFLQTTWHITLPLLRAPLLVALLIRLIDSLRWFDTIWIMTRGGPGNSTHVLSVYLFEKAFMFFQMGKSSAIAFIILAITIGMTATLIKTMGKEYVK